MYGRVHNIQKKIPIVSSNQATKVNNEKIKQQLEFIHENCMLRNQTEEYILYRTEDIISRSRI
jgi:hypothetical protein